ncbi:MAG: hypothetical protein JWM13_3012, partial [Arthrobacter sp.]|nr:hypothetical protein [Arthrobacter sp.]
MTLANRSDVIFAVEPLEKSDIAKAVATGLVYERAGMDLTPVFSFGVSHFLGTGTLTPVHRVLTLEDQCHPISLRSRATITGLPFMRD